MGLSAQLLSRYIQTMSKTADQIRTGGMWPEIEPFDRFMLSRDNGHSLYVEQCGNPQGRPVLVLHGGPGGGCSPFMRRFFDPRYWRIVLFDQRGCGRSQPHASIEANSTHDLIGDIEAIRAHLSLGRIVSFGGSWGATLALAHAQAHPDAVSAMVLRGVFLARQEDLDWFYGGGAAQFFPDIWDAFCEPIPVAERGDMIAAYHKRLFSGDEESEVAHARLWARWENALAGMHAPLGDSGAPSGYLRAFARLECHYFQNKCFMAEGQLLQKRPLIEHIPTVIIQGRHDIICPPYAAYDLARDWENCSLHLIAAAGHAMSEPPIAAALLDAMEALRQACNQ